MTDRFLIIGGGIRLEKACEAFTKRGYKAEIYKGGKPLKTAIDNADVILLGLPSSKSFLTFAMEITLLQITLLIANLQLFSR